MAMKDLPRPWLLAALADVPITELARLDMDEPCEDEGRWLPRADQRRRRLATWRGPRLSNSYDAWWHSGLEGERAS